jgi:UDP-N-acetylglucosamine--N-acetylmuramyl-(pentapeptide) pyrophosphoryl-undecaprenol N-acetylglucosamine transferase
MAKIIIAGGGTGGHIFPAIAIANAIKKLAPSTQFLFVGANGKMEMEKIPQAGYTISGIDIAGFNRSSLFKNIFLPFKLIKSFFQVRKIFTTFMPDAVVGVGGYSSFPVLKYAQTRNITTFIHESNAFAGKANTLLGKNCKKVFVASEGMEQFFPTSKLLVVGNPVRAEIANNSTSEIQARQNFKLDAGKPVVLVIGGSLGAKNINAAIAKQISQIIAANLQVIWQTGKPFFEEAKKVVADYTGVYCTDFITDMQLAYAAADMVISRSGAMAIAELAIVGKPTIFVPYPFAAEDHQTANAKNLVNKEAGILISDDMAVTTLVATLIDLSKNMPLQQKLANNIKKTAIVNADAVIAKQILESING